MIFKIYTVHAYRWGDREKHSYFVGAWTSEESARFYAHKHEELRGGKYVCEITMSTPHDSFNHETGRQDQVTIKSL